jgi:type IV secretory pathway VirB2 component (pilin)
MTKIFHNIKFDSDFYQRVCLFFTLLSFIFVSQEAFASSDAISQVLCNVINQLQGGIGKGIATIAIIVLGIGLFLGKLSWPLAIATAIGIGLIFGAAGIVGWISPGSGSGCTTAR